MHVKITLFQGPRHTEYNISEVIGKQILTVVWFVWSSHSHNARKTKGVCAHVSACFKPTIQQFMHSCGLIRFSP